MNKREISDYELALFELVRKDIIKNKSEHGSSDEEIDEVAYRSIDIIMSSMRFDKIKEHYEQGKRMAEEGKLYH